MVSEVGIEESRFMFCEFSSQLGRSFSVSTSPDPDHFSSFLTFSLFFPIAVELK